MKIAAISTEWISIPFDHGGPSSGFTVTNWNSLDTLIVKVETDTGVTGYGEAFGYNAIPATKAAVERILAPVAIGKDAGDIRTTMHELQQALHIFGRYGVTMYALSGLDMALWDIAGKVAGLPLHRLFGAGGDKPTLPAYASLLRYGDDIDAVKERVSDAVAQGYGFVKLHQKTVPTIAAAREAAGPEPRIMVDVNCPWTVQQSLEMARAIEPYDIHWLEEPVWPPENFDGLAEVSAGAPMPVAAGENACTAWDFQKMFQAGAVTYAQPSVTKVGGVTEFRKVMALAEANNVLLAPHSPYFGPGFLATLQLLAGTEIPVERYFGRPEASLFGDTIHLRDGRLVLPAGPGLGCDPDPDVVRTYRKKGQ